MEQLSSCYFCGTALDEPLGTYLLGGDSPGGRVTLCPTCHEKLETTFDAAGVDTDVLPEDDASKPASHAETTGEEAGEAIDGEEESETADDNPVRTIVGGATDEKGDEADDEPPQEEAQDEPAPEAMDADDILVDLGDEDALDSTAGGSEETGQAETEPDAPGGFEPLEPADDGGAAGGDGESDQPGAGAPDRTISKREFNKVMRLLQNREFPVDRMEILTVATGAYDLRQPEVAQAIDLAIDRGVIDEDEEEGQLVRPE